MSECEARRHRIAHRRAPCEWHDGFALGNGAIGAMFWGDGNPLCLTLDKADLWDLRSDDTYLQHPDYSYAGLRRLVSEGRFDEALEIFEDRYLRDNPIGPAKVSIGRAEVTLGAAIDYECRLELSSASVAGTLRTAGGEHEVLAFAHRERNVVCLRVTSLPEDARLSLKPLAEMNDSLAALGHPPPQVTEEGAACVASQSIPEGPSYAVVWNPRGPDFLLAIESGDTPEQARDRALDTWQAAVDAGLDCLHEEHVTAWRPFWERSAVYLPEERIEFLWYFGLYLLASGARRGELPPGLQGPWAMDGVLPPWRGEYAADMNLQETFWPAAAAGHLDLLDCWCDFMRGLPAAGAGVHAAVLRYRGHVLALHLRAGSGAHPVLVHDHVRVELFRLAGVAGVVALALQHGLQLAGAYGLPAGGRGLALLPRQPGTGS